jgi:hypothetical protein
MSECIERILVGGIREINYAGGTPWHVPYEPYSLSNYGDFVIRKSRSKVSRNMDKLWMHFHYKQNYPEYYLGIAEKVAICKCPTSGVEKWYNAKRCLSVQTPKPGDIVTATVRQKDITSMTNVIFIGWVKTPIHEWRMDNQSVLQLEQNFIDGLFQHEKRLLKINR